MRLVLGIITLILLTAVFILSTVFAIIGGASAVGPLSNITLSDQNLTNPENQTLSDSFLPANIEIIDEYYKNLKRYVPLASNNSTNYTTDVSLKNSYDNQISKQIPREIFLVKLVKPTTLRKVERIGLIDDDNDFLNNNLREMEEDMVKIKNLNRINGNIANTTELNIAIDKYYIDSMKIMNHFITDYTYYNSICYAYSAILGSMSKYGKEQSRLTTAILIDLYKIARLAQINSERSITIAHDTIKLNSVGFEIPPEELIETVRRFSGSFMFEIVSPFVREILLYVYYEIDNGKSGFSERLIQRLVVQYYLNIYTKNKPGFPSNRNLNINRKYSNRESISAIKEIINERCPHPVVCSMREILLCREKRIKLKLIKNKKN